MPDTDKDGLSDAAERRLGTDPKSKDSDGDGLTDWAETQLGTDPLVFDTDGDGFGDGNEVAQHHNPLVRDTPSRYGPDTPHRVRPDDPDGDGLDEMMERMVGTKPNDLDSDGDGLSDYVESIRGTDPLSKFSDGKGDRTTDLQDVQRELAASKGAADMAKGALGGALAGAGAGAMSAAPADGLQDSFDAPVDADADPSDDGADPADGGAASYRSPSAVSAEQARTAFLDAARAQIGDKYVFGAETDLTDPDPTAFDSSELVQWAAAQAGVEVPDGSWKQYQFLHEKGAAMSVQDALATPGALVFGFSSDPLTTKGRPTRAYVAISLGNGKVLDVSERAGEVREMEPGNFFTHAAYIPGMAEDIDSDGDGMIDIDERVMERDPFDAADGTNGPSTTPSTVEPPVLDPTDPNPPDTDGDGMPDVDEQVLGLDPNDPSDGPNSWKTPSTVEPPVLDPTDPNPPDTDGDGMPDVDEQVLGLDPNDPSDGPNSWNTTPSTPEPDAAGYEDAGYDDAGYDDAGYDDAGLDDAGYEDAGLDDAGYEDAGYEDAGLDDAGYEDAGYEG